MRNTLADPPESGMKTFFPGGIAQLVERQLCKLDVRGSNPLASIGGFARHTKSYKERSPLAINPLASIGGFARHTKSCQERSPPAINPLASMGVFSL